MRTSFNLSRVGRSLLVSVKLAALVASPQVAAGQGIVQQRTDPVADFQKFLPPVPSIPWREVRSAAAQKTARALPEAGTEAAWLLTPRPAVSWASGPPQAALTGDDVVGM